MLNHALKDEAATACLFPSTAPELLAPLAFRIYTSVFQDAKSQELLKLQNGQWKSNSPKKFRQHHRHRNVTRGMTLTFVSYVRTTHKPWHTAQHINQQHTTQAEDRGHGTLCRLDKKAKKTIKTWYKREPESFVLEGWRTSTR